MVYSIISVGILSEGDTRLLTTYSSQSSNSVETSVNGHKARKSTSDPENVKTDLRYGEEYYKLGTKGGWALHT